MPTKNSFVLFWDAPLFCFCFCGHVVRGFRPVSASAGDIPFFTLAFVVALYKRRNLFSNSSVIVSSLFALSRARLKVTTKRLA